ncbi:hypothetical protein DYB32_002835 [Aphanomyces invadans]|uniref:Ciliary BBSome complex subunit 2 middle region domain-containing protein n=1 Tax=Aphanomyces invadans TaxID=157072 RepID=A0A418B280_9STRA|nr:hypothetical protein DYB32_002835 [Aphanomyces invadans]
MLSSRDVCVATDYIYNQFENGVDKETVMCQDRINDLLLHRDAESNEFHAVLGCQDKYIRVMKVPDAMIPASSPFRTIGLVSMTGGGKIKTVWKTAQDKTAPSPITSMVAYDINKDDAVEVVIGREDGRVEIYSVDESGNIVKEFEHVASESVRAIQAGVLGTPVRLQKVMFPIACVSLHSTVPLDLLDTAKNQAILCRSPADPANHTHVLATYRCQELTNRLEFRIRTLEGQYGEVELTVLAETVPKSAQCVKIVVKPLSLHHRVNVVDSKDVDEAVMNSLYFTGAFSLVQVHEWVAFCLPDVPVRMQDDEGKLYFRNAFVGNVLVCEYRKGEARFLSSSVSTIAILKEVITKEATIRKVTLNMTFDIKNESTPAVLALLRPKLDEKQMLASQVKIIEGIKELQMHEADHSLWMSSEYQRILADADRIVADFQASPRAMSYITGVLTDLFVDISKFRGVNAHLPRLFQILDQYNYDALVEFFTRAP